MILYQYWCASQHFTRLLWDFYIWWACWLLNWLWNFLAPGFPDRLWDLASFWLQLIVEIPPGSKVRYPDLVVPSLRATLVVPTLGSCPKFPPPSYVTYLTSPSRATLAINLSLVWPTIPFWSGISWHLYKTKGNNKVEIKLEGLVVLDVFFVSTLSSLHVVWF